MAGERAVPEWPTGSDVSAPVRAPVPTSVIGAKPSPRLLKLHAVAAELSISLDTLDRLIRRRQIPVVRMPGGRRRIAREDLDATIARWREDGR